MNLDNALDIHAPQRLDELSGEQLDQLPFGAIRVDADGRILFYSRAQARITNRDPAAVIGRNFFSEVAPCTVVPDFYGQFRQGVLTGRLNSTFEFVFDFEMQPVQVRITMRAADRPGEFWILVQPLRRLSPRDAGATRALISDKFDAPGSALSAVSFDFSKCDREPIATCGAIQPYGCLLVLDPDSLRILACSANTGMYLGREPDRLLDAPLAQALTFDPAGEPLDVLLANLRDPDHCPDLLPAMAPGGDLPLTVRPHPWRGRLLLEVEPHGEMPLDARVRDFNYTAFQRRLMGYREVAEICQQAVDRLRHLSGFERVLVYRFEPDEDGVVIAESVLEGA